MWTPNLVNIEWAVGGDAEYLPMVPGPTLDQLRQWHDINKTITADDNDGDGENSE